MQPLIGDSVSRLFGLRLALLLAISSLRDVKINLTIKLSMFFRARVTKFCRRHADMLHTERAEIIQGREIHFICNLRNRQSAILQKCQGFCGCYSVDMC